MDSLIDELEKIERLKRCSKARSMIYQCEAKEQLALANGKPIETYYYLPYEDWIVISKII